MSDIGNAVFAAMSAISMTGLLVDSAIKLAPIPQTSDYFEVHQITAERRGNTVILWVDRTIHQPIEMRPYIRLLEATPEGDRIYCDTPDAPMIRYKTTAVMPEPATLEWWSFGDCADVPEGAFEIETTWTPRHPLFASVTYSVHVPAKEDTIGPR